MVASQNNCESVSENATMFYGYLLFSVVGLKITKCYSKEWVNEYSFTYSSYTWVSFRFVKNFYQTCKTLLNLKEEHRWEMVGSQHSSDDVIV